MTALNVGTRIFADGADLADLRTLAANPVIGGFTTNPSLMRAAGVNHYESFAKEALEIIGGRPISFEVFSDDFRDMARQARKIASWGENVYVKVPVTNTLGESSEALISSLSGDGLKLNVTALLTSEQVATTVRAFAVNVPGYISVFAGRIADTGVDPLPIMCEALTVMANNPSLELIWASPRELLNVVQAGQIGCHVITVTNDLLRKMPVLGKDLAEFSLDTIKMFADDAAQAGYEL